MSIQTNNWDGNERFLNPVTNIRVIWKNPPKLELPKQELPKEFLEWKRKYK